MAEDAYKEEFDIINTRKEVKKKKITEKEEETDVKKIRRKVIRSQDEYKGEKGRCKKKHEKKKITEKIFYFSL